MSEEEAAGKGKIDKGSKPKAKEKIPAASTKARSERKVLLDEVKGMQATGMSEEARKLLKKELGNEKEKKQRESFFKMLLKPFGLFGLITGKLVSPLTNLLADKKEIPEEEFTKVLEESTKKTKEELNISESVFAHQINTPEEINEQINAGERQIEIDLRLGKDGEIYVVHDTIANEEDPSSKFPKLADVLHTFANHDVQDVSIYFDIKDVGVLDKLDLALAEFDASPPQGKEGYIPLGERHFIGSFNHEILAKAKERDPHRPTILTYIPAAELKSVSALMKLIGHQKLGNVAKEIDKIAGTALEKEMGNLQIHIDGKTVEGHTEGAQNIVNVFHLLPPEDILKNVDIIAIPSPLATQKLIDRAHEKGVKVGLWGGSAKDIQHALALGADIVISDTPEYLRTDTGTATQSLSPDAEKRGESKDSEKMGEVINFPSKKAEARKEPTQQDKAA